MACQADRYFQTDIRESASHADYAGKHDFIVFPLFVTYAKIPNCKEHKAQYEYHCRYVARLFVSPTEYLAYPSKFTLKCSFYMKMFHLSFGRNWIIGVFG